MKPLFVLLAAFAIGITAEYMISGEMHLDMAGRIALTVMLFFTAFGHFKFSKGMALMIPDFIPARRLIITVTGIIEMLLAVAIHITAICFYAGWLLIAMLCCFLPANVYAASHRINYETASYDGKGLSYLWFRIPFQWLLIAWTWYFVIQPNTVL